MEEPNDETNNPGQVENKNKLVICPSFEEKFKTGKFGKNNLNVFYTYVGSVPITGTNVPGPNKVLTCKMYKQQKRGDTAENFEKHLQKKHKDMALYSALDVQSSNSFVKSCNLPLKQVAKVDESSAQELRFKQCMVDLVAVDGLPIQFVEGKAFQSFIRMFLPHLNLQCRRSVKRDLTKFVSNGIIPMLKATLRDISYIHLTLDIWNSRRREAVLGVKCHFIDESFKLEHRTLAFVHFKEQQTGQNILSKLEGIFQNLNIVSTQIITVCADNASNLIKAFNLQALYAEPWDDSDDPLDDAWTDDSWIILKDTVAKAKWNRLSCVAHTIQLVVVNNLRNESSSKPVCDYVHGVIMFFRKSTQWTETLRTKSNCLDLV